MCSSKVKVTTGIEPIKPAVAKINGRPVLQPTCNRVPNLERRTSLKKLSPPPLPTFATTTVNKSNNKTSLNGSATPPISPKSKSPRPLAIKRGNDNNNNNSNALNSSSEKVVIPRNNTVIKTLERKKSKSFKEASSSGHVLGNSYTEASLTYSSSLIVESPGSIAAVRREQMALQHAQRKMRIAHYGRSKSAKFESNKIVPLHDRNDHNSSTDQEEDHKRCSFITANSDPIYVAYHDQEWGVPVHDDNMLFELLVLSGAQVGSDWTSILKKRQDFRDAFSGFDAEIVASLTDKQMMSISTQYDVDISRVRGVVDNSNRILEIKREFGTFEKYIWGFVNKKPISTQYKFGHKIPVKTSKSESISKDMVRRGFRFVGALDKGGVGALELVAMDIKARGMYVCRTLSYKGVDFEVVEAPLEVEMMRFFRHMCMSAKVPATVRLAKKALLEDKCVVIGLQSTGEARTEEAMTKYGLELDDFISGPRELLLKFVEENYPLPEKPDPLPGEESVKELQRKRHSASPGVSLKGRVRKVAKWKPASDAESDEESDSEFLDLDITNLV
ncbi:hypothetical protein LWI28_015533 [Acer negundo]|uniref:DNA-3-methyladenine glycosylase I n=1 Tax=Acer negundo TaxID=4023 RepID=A0AAD5II60_ACENE|nr:hypothetical protein LWI28_015533 [Acer negundo]